MTFSLVARDEPTGRIGIGIASCVLAVGARCTFVRTNVGAIASQALTNPYWGPRGLALLAAGADAANTARMLAAADEGRDLRQLIVMDREGRFAAHTGARCKPWCGHRIGPDWAVAGNILAGEAVLAAMAEALESNREEPLSRRLIAALKAGEAAGGDTRGRQSAALLVHDQEDYALYDLRIDDHADPLTELARLEAKARERAIHVRHVLPSRDMPHGLTGDAEIEAAIAASIKSGYE